MYMHQNGQKHHCSEELTVLLNMPMEGREMSNKCSLLTQTSSGSYKILEHLIKKAKGTGNPL